jgi:hypothetical protein
LITLILFGEVQKLWSSSLCNPPASRHFLPLRSKYSPQYPVLKHLQSLFFPTTTTTTTTTTSRDSCRWG